MRLEDEFNHGREAVNMDSLTNGKWASGNNFSRKMLNYLALEKSVFFDFHSLNQQFLRAKKMFVVFLLLDSVFCDKIRLAFKYHAVKHCNIDTILSAL